MGVRPLAASSPHSQVWKAQETDISSRQDKHPSGITAKASERIHDWPGAALQNLMVEMLDTAHEQIPRWQYFRCRHQITCLSRQVPPDQRQYFHTALASLHSCLRVKRSSIHPRPFTDQQGRNDCSAASGRPGSQPVVTETSGTASPERPAEMRQVAGKPAKAMGGRFRPCLMGLPGPALWLAENLSRALSPPLNGKIFKLAQILHGWPTSIGLRLAPAVASIKGLPRARPGP